ncbi:hypothetical protein J0A68_14245 [Algoriphagus sp. H41]|uniref:PepSY domain-containing protein n=1 Tax=Algoriphagus oliviformis TaxID=2811231 RepID=A0ABS3C7I6_9BACT|nr:hypothetical protein [Algoriphagus oliviformis]MBN7812110.1 hypothetical protein [Algoriphagus oliviformis]
MKKTAFLSALIVAGAAFAAPTLAYVAHAPVAISLQEEQIQIKPDDLPTPVKQTITSDESLKEYPVSEAWQNKCVEGKITYRVSFDNGTADKLWKAYDPEGKEITE